MGKNSAVNQRAYRERKKAKEGENYFANERRRVKSYYVPVSERSKKEATERREKVRKWVKDYRKRQKDKTKLEQKKIEIEQNNCETPSGNLTVKMPFPDP